MIDQAHMYKMAYAQIETGLLKLIEACYDKDGRPRMPKAGDINEAIAYLPEGRRPGWATSSLEKPSLEEV